PSADLAFASAGTDAAFACPALAADELLSQFVSTSAYEFNDENAPQDFLPPVTFPYGAAHASEIQYLFALPVSVPHPPLNAAQTTLSHTMQRYWTNFAKTGTPNTLDAPFWQRFSAINGNFQSLEPATPVQETNFAVAHHCAFWSAIAATK